MPFGCLTQQNPPINFVSWCPNQRTDIVKSTATSYTIRSTIPSKFDTDENKGRGFAPYAIARVGTASSFCITCDVSIQTTASVSNPRIMTGIGLLDSEYNRIVEVGVGSWESGGEFNTVPIERYSSVTSTKLGLKYDLTTPTNVAVHNGESDTSIRISTGVQPTYVVLFLRGYDVYTSTFTNLSYNGLVEMTGPVTSQPQNYIELQDTTTDAVTLSEGTADFSNCQAVCNNTLECTGFEFQESINKCIIKKVSEPIPSKDPYDNSADRVTFINPSNFNTGTLTPEFAFNSIGTLLAITNQQHVILLNRQTNGNYSISSTSLQLPSSTRTKTPYVTFDNLGNILVSDAATQSVYMYKFDGATKTYDDTATPITLITGIANCSKIALDSRGRVLIVFQDTGTGSGNYLKQYDYTTPTPTLKITIGPDNFVDFALDKEATKLVAIGQPFVRIYTMQNEQFLLFQNIVTTGGGTLKKVALDPKDDYITVCLDEELRLFKKQSNGQYTLNNRFTNDYINLDKNGGNPVKFRNVTFDPTGIYMAVSDVIRPNFLIHIFIRQGDNTFTKINDINTGVTLKFNRATGTNGEFTFIQFNPLTRDLVATSVDNGNNGNIIKTFIKQTSNEPDRFTSSGTGTNSNLYMKVDSLSFFSRLGVRYIFNPPLKNVIRDYINVDTLIIDASFGVPVFFVVTDKKEIFSSTFFYHVMTYPISSQSSKIGFRIPLKDYGDFYVLTDNLDFDDITIINNEQEDVLNLPENALAPVRRSKNKNPGFSLANIAGGASATWNKSIVLDQILHIPTSVTKTINFYSQSGTPNIYRVVINGTTTDNFYMYLENFQIILKRQSDNAIVAIFIILNNSTIVLVHVNQTYKTYFDLQQSELNIMYTMNSTFTTFYEQLRSEQSATYPYLTLDEHVLQTINSLDRDFSFNPIPLGSEELLLYLKRFVHGPSSTSIFFKDDQTLLINDTLEFRYFIYNGYVIYTDRYGTVNVICVDGTNYSNLYRVISTSFKTDQSQYVNFGPYVIQSSKTSQLSSQSIYRDSNGRTLQIDINNKLVRISTIGSAINIGFYGFGIDKIRDRFAGTGYLFLDNIGDYSYNYVENEVILLNYPSSNWGYYFIYYTQQNKFIFFEVYQDGSYTVPFIFTLNGGATGTGPVLATSFHLLNRGLRKCISPRTSPPANQEELVLDTSACFSTNSNSKFILTQRGSIKHQVSGKCVQPYGGGTATSGTNLVLQDGCDIPDGRTTFTITPAGSIKHVSTGLCVHNEYAATADGTRLVLFGGCDSEERLKYNRVDNGISLANYLQEYFYGVNIPRASVTTFLQGVNSLRLSAGYYTNQLNVEFVYTGGVSNRVFTSTDATSFGGVNSETQNLIERIVRIFEGSEEYIMRIRVYKDATPVLREIVIWTNLDSAGINGAFVEFKLPI